MIFKVVLIPIYPFFIKKGGISLKKPYSYGKLKGGLERSVVNFIQQYKRGLSNRVVKSFLYNQEHFHLFLKAICFPTADNIEELNQAFRRHYIVIRLTHYLSKLLSHTSRDYYHKHKKRQYHCLLIFDQPINKGDSVETIGNLIDINESDTAEKVINKQDNFLEHIEDSSLYHILTTLSKRQLEILELSFLDNLTHKQIAKILGITPQAVSKSYRQAVKKLAEAYKMRDSYGTV